MSEINWSVFTVEEKEALEKLVAMGEVDNIANGVLEMTIEKEKELQKLSLQMRPISQEFESKVMEQWTKERLEKGLEPSPQSPEEEKELQAQLDAEMATFQKEHAEKNAARVQGEAPFCQFCDSRGVKHKANCTKIK